MKNINKFRDDKRNGYKNKQQSEPNHKKEIIARKTLNKVEKNVADIS